ncbi:MAG TPA: hybrid sensor histidine kinase/response regulator [Ktedonobacteraceae bacterium]|jgi:signal transduction histidine kinase|nr:hybrid sensor histidine kinase/response regulator [Ktedonobacteraceae bacterium]
MSDTRILIVDDDPALLQALPQAITLRIQQVSIDVSDSAADALQLVQQHAYDAIVSDIKMPGMDGLALIEKLQTLCPDTPTLLITGHGEHNLAIQALRVGAYDFIQKPIDREYFITALRRAIQIYQLRRRIAEQQQALEQHASHLEQAVDERTRELIEANAAKDAFLSMASHELKTPLTTIKGISQMLHRRIEHGGSIDLKPLELLENSVHRMEILVNDILSTSLVDADMFSLNRQPEDLVALCHEILAGYRISMGSSLNLEILAPTLPVSVDRERISQVILNLLSNARKYSPPNALITVRAMRQNQQAIVSVADQGIGISSEQLDHIFERFYRVPGVAVQTGSSVGVGLGLYIAKSIVENHHGLLSATSTPSQGSIFTFSLPLLLEEKQSSGDGDGKAIQTQANVSLW